MPSGSGSPSHPTKSAVRVLQQIRLKYFDYGVVSLGLELQFDCAWEELIRLSSPLVEAPDLERSAIQVGRRRMADLSGAIRRAYPEWLDEVYYAVRVREFGDSAPPASVPIAICLNGRVHPRYLCQNCAKTPSI